MARAKKKAVKKKAKKRNFSAPALQKTLMNRRKEQEKILKEMGR